MERRVGCVSFRDVVVRGKNELDWNDLEIMKEKKPIATEGKPCAECVHSKPDERRLLRCHLNPPFIRFPYHEMSAWPVVPERGGGCSHWRDAL